MKSKKGYFFKKKMVFYLFVLPGAVYMTLMIILPICSNIIMSFQDVNLMNFASKERNFVGLAMYQDILREDVTWVAVKNTLWFTFWCLVFQFPIGFALALLFSKEFKGSRFLRGINVVAWMIPMVAVAGIFKYMFNSDIGIINQILMNLHIVDKPVEWLAHGNTAMASIIVANVWKGVPFNMILLAIVSVLTLGFIYTFKVFDLVYVITGGGPGSSTEMLSTLAYRYSFNEYNFSQGAAVANVLFILLMLVGLVYIKIVTKEDGGDR